MEEKAHRDQVRTCEHRLDEDRSQLQKHDDTGQSQNKRNTKRNAKLVSASVCNDCNGENLNNDSDLNGNKADSCESHSTTIIDPGYQHSSLSLKSSNQSEQNILDVIEKYAFNENDQNDQNDRNDKGRYTKSHDSESPDSYDSVADFTDITHKPVSFHRNYLRSRGTDVQYDEKQLLVRDPGLWGFPPTFRTGSNEEGYRMLAQTSNLLATRPLQESLGRRKAKFKRLGDS